MKLCERCKTPIPDNCNPLCVVCAPTPATGEQIQFCPHGCVGECFYMRAGRKDRHDCCPYGHTPASVTDIKPTPATDTPSPIPFRLRQPHSDYVDEAAAEYIERLEAELKKYKQLHAKSVHDAIMRICPNCGDDCCGDDHRHCYRCDLAAMTQRCEELEKALVDMTRLASISYNGDPWYFDGNHKDEKTADQIFDAAKQALTKEPR